MRAFILMLTMLLLVACDQNPAPDEGKADRLAAAFVEAINAQDYPKAFSMVDAEAFFGAHSQSEWESYFNGIHDVLGKKETTRLKNKLNDLRLSGTFFMYEYVSKHEHGLSKELVTIVHQINTGAAPLKVFSYKIDSSKLQKLNQSW